MNPWSPTLLAVATVAVITLGAGPGTQPGPSLEVIQESELTHSVRTLTRRVDELEEKLARPATRPVGRSDLLQVPGVGSETADRILESIPGLRVKIQEGGPSSE